MANWLMKSEPDVYSIDDLKKDKRTHWDGIRNYQARNMMRDDMRPGDNVFFYHSNCDEPGIVGLAKVAGKPYPDPTQFDPESKYFDPKSSELDSRRHPLRQKAETDDHARRAEAGRRTRRLYPDEKGQPAVRHAGLG